MSKKEKQLSPFEEKLNNWVSDHLSHVPFIQKIFFIDHLRTMVHAGLSLIEALDILEKETENRAFRRIIHQIKEDVNKGNTLSATLEKYPRVFPPIYVKMVEAGEVGGKLEESLGQIATQMKKSQELTSSIRGAMIYPAVIVLAMMGIGIMMTTVVLPKLIVIFQEFDAELPLATRLLITVVEIMSNPLYLTIILVSFVLFIVLFVVMLRKSPAFKHAVHAVNLRLPIIGPVIKKINLARFSLTLSSLLKSAIPIIDAVSITGETCSNVLYRKSLKGASETVASGTPLSVVLRESDRLFPPMVTEMVMVGERTGEIENLLSELSDFYNNEVDKTMKNFTTVIEPILIIFLGVAVGGVAVAVIMPMYSLVQSF